MTYKPTLADMQEAQAMQPQQQVAANSAPQQGTYQPTLADMQEAQTQQQQQQHPSLARRAVSYPAAILSGLAEGTRQLVNLPSEAINLISGRDLAPKIPKEAVGDLNQYFNLPAHSIIKSLGETVPAFLGGEAALPLKAAKALEKVPMLSRNVAAQMAGSGLYGASESADTAKKGSTVLTDAAISAALGGGIGKGFEVAGNVLKPLAHSLMDSVVDPILAKTMNAIETQEKITPTTSSLEDVYSVAKEKAGKWGDLKEKAMQMDKEKVPFDNTHYTNKVKDTLKELEENVKEDSDTFAPLLEKVQKKLEVAPKTYKSAIAQKTAINKLPKSWGKDIGDSTVDYSRKIAHDLGNALDENLDKLGQTHGETHPEIKKFTDDWREKRQAYGELAEFKQHPTKSVFSSDMANMLEKGDFSDITKKYLPQKSKDGTSSLQKFTHLMGGDINKSRPILQEEFLKPYIAEGKLNSNKFLTHYQKLSPTQKSYLFTQDQSKWIDSALKARTITQQEALKALPLRKGVASLMGMAAGKAIGGTAGELALGTVAYHTPRMLAGLSKKIARQRYSTPEGVETLKGILRDAPRKGKKAYGAIVPSVAYLQSLQDK